MSPRSRSTSPDSSQLLADALELTSSERGRIAAMLIESPKTETEADAESLWSDEIRRRADEIKSGQATMISWLEVRHMLRGSHEQAIEFYAEAASEATAVRNWYQEIDAPCHARYVPCSQLWASMFADIRMLTQSGKHGTRRQ